MFKRMCSSRNLNLRLTSILILLALIPFALSAQELQKPDQKTDTQERGSLRSPYEAVPATAQPEGADPEVGMARLAGILESLSTNPFGPKEFQSTSYLVPISCNGAGGLWSSGGTWAGGIVPTSADAVTIPSGCTVTVDTAGAAAQSLTIQNGGVVTFDAVTPSTLTVSGPVTIDSGGIFQTPATGAITTHVLSLSGSLTNNGTLDFSTNGNTAGAGITFTGAGNTTFGGSGSVTNIRTLTINKGTSYSNILELNPTNLTVQGTTTDGTPMAFLTLTNGTLKISGSFTMSARLFSAAAYTIPATAGLWINNANFAVAGQNGSPTMSGLLRVTNGSFNVGTASGNSMAGATTSVFIIEGGTASFTGRLNVTSATAIYSQTGGTVNVSTIGNASSSNGSFGFSSTSSFFNMSGGTINLVQASTAATPIDYQVSSAAFVTGGTLNVGTSATATNFVFRVQGQMPNVVIDTTTNNKTANLSAQGNVWGNLTIPVGTTLNLNPGTAQTLLMIGPTITNNGAIVVNTTNTGSINFAGGLQTALAPYAQSYTGTGTVGSGALRLGNVAIQNASGATIDPAASVFNINRINAFFGTITNSDKLAVGAGDATALVIQRGATGIAFPAGSVDVSPTFNIGSGGLTLVYSQSLTAMTTGPEVPGTRSVLSIQILNPTGVTLAGGPLTATGTTSGLLLSSGTLNTTGANLLTLAGTTTGALTGGSAATYVNGPLARTLPASLVSGSTYTFPVGKGSFKMLELVNPTTNAGGTVVVQAEAFDANSGGTAGTGFSSINTNRYWSAAITSGGANFTNATVRLTEQGTSAANGIGQSATQAGTYDSIGGTVTAPTIGPSSAVTSLGFFAVGTLTGAPTITGSFNVGAGGAYATLTAAIADLNSKIMTGPVTISLTDNVYAGETFPIIIQPNAGASATNTLTIKPAPGVTPAFSGSSASALLILNGADYVTIDGSNTPGGTTRDTSFANTNTGTSSAVIWGQTVGTGDPAANNVIKNVNVLGNAATTTLAGIGFGSSTISSATLGTRNNNNVIQNNSIGGAQFGALSQGASSTNKNTGTVITGNTIGGGGASGIGRAGIYVAFDDGAQITNNSVMGVGATASADGFGIALGSFSASLTTFTTNNDVANVTISGNTIGSVVKTDTFSGIGISLATNNYGTSRIVNNFVYGAISNGTAGDFSGGIYVGNTGSLYATTQVYFNSVSMTGARDGATLSTQPSYAFAVLGANPLVDVRNNIFYNSQTASNGGPTGSAGSYAIGLSAAMPLNQVTSNYNDLYTTGASAHFALLGSLTAVQFDLANLAAWQAATGKDANSISADPLYTSATDLHLTAMSPAINVGTAIGGITTDIDGDTRPQGAAVEMGADEVIQLSPGTLAFSSATYSIGEGGGSVTLTVNRTGGSSGSVQVDYSLAGGTATGGGACGGSVDYVNIGTSLVFADGETSKMFNVTICPDSTFEGDETFNATLSNPTNGATIGSPNPATVTITEDKGQPTVQFSSATYSTIDELGGGGTINVTLSGPSATNVTVNYATVAGGTATGGASCLPGVDYINTSGTMTFLPGEVSKSFIVPTCFDNVDEPDETVNLALTSPVGATLGMPNTAVLTIIDNDVAGTLQFSLASFANGESGGTATIFVTRTGGTSGSVSVDYATVAGGTATGGATCSAGVDYQNTSGTVTFPNGVSTSQSFTVPLCPDSAVEGDETVNLALSNATGGATIGSPGTAVLTIIDDDMAAGPITVTATAGTPGPTDYPTLKDAFDAINAGTHQGVITITVVGNTTEAASAVLNNSGAGSANYTSVSIAPSGGARVIEGSIVGAVVKLNGADNVTIDGRIAGSGRNLTIRNNSTATATAAIWLSSVAVGNGASNNVIRNLEVAAGASANLNTNTTIGILMAGTTVSVTADGNDNDNNQFIANRITKARYGIVTRGVAANNNEGLMITDNIIGPASFGADEIGKTGMFLQQDTGAIVSRNTVQFVGGDLANTTAGADRCGICIGGENWSQTESAVLTSGDYSVTRNSIHDIVEERTFSSLGIRLGTTRAGSATNNLVANNFIYNVRSNGTAGDQLVGIGYAGGHTDRIVFNSIVMTGDMDPTGATNAAIYGNGMRVSTVNGTNNVNLTMMDNSVYVDVNSNTATNHYYAITLPSAAYVFGTGGLNYNNYYINAANTQLRTGGLGVTSGNTPGTEFATLANWQAALTTPQDANSIQANPLHFSLTSDPHITGASPNINAGTAVAGITDDFDGQTRPNGPAPDIGADEFYPSPGSLQFGSATFTTTEVAGTATITVTRTGGGSGAVSVDYATVAGGTATGGASCTAGVDYINTSGTLMWADNDLASKTFNVTVCNDGVTKGNETVNLALSNPTGGATVGSPANAVLTILNSITFGSSVNVGTGETYTSLTNPGGLFETINNGALSGNLTVNITSDLTAETGAIPLNQFSGGFTLTIRPSGGALRIVSGGSPTVLLDFNGADGVTIDGLNTGGNALTIRYSAVGTGTAVRFINDASNNTVTNTTLEGGGTSSILSISTGVTTGNDNISITGNTIRDRTDATSVPFNSINLIGTSAAISNTNVVISNNQLINFTQAGIVIGTSDNVTFTNNTISQTASRTTALFGVAVNSATGTNLFSQNTVRDLTTTLGTTGMQFNDARDTTVSRNRVYNFASTSGSTGVLTGIVFNGASGTNATVTVVNNMVSLIPNFNNNQIIRGIFDFGFGGNTFNSYFNSVLVGGTNTGAASSWACVRGTAAPTSYTMLDNICFNNRTGGTGSHFAMGDQSNGTGTLTSNYNIFVGTGATAANFFDRGTAAAGTPVDFAAWQVGGRDANSQASNPGGNYTVANMFVSTTDLHLNTMGTNPASNAGTPAGGVTIDFDGDTRSVTTPDIGFDEVGGAVVPGVLQFSAPTYSVGEAGPVATITVTRTGGTDGMVGVSYATVAGGTATGGSVCGGAVDYVDTIGMLSWANGDGANKTFTIPICQDPTDEPDETINMQLSAPTGGATIGAQSTAVLTILDDDAPAPTFTVAISDARKVEGNAGSSNMVFNVTLTPVGSLSPEGSTIASVQYATANGTATAGSDYSMTAGTLNFAIAGTQQISVPIAGDVNKESNEFFFVNLSNPSANTTITDNQGAGIIVDEDRAYPADFDRDLKTDFSVFRLSTTLWYVLKSSDGSFTASSAGPSGDVAVPGDYDGDGKADVAVYQQSSSNWFVLRSSDGVIQTTLWGVTGDKPVQGDYDGDGKTDHAVFRPSTGTWWVLRSSNGTSYAQAFGISTDRLVQGDYDGDFKTDLAVYRDGTWYIARSSDSMVFIQNWGIASDKPVAGDFDGDGRNDLAIYRNGAWWVLNSLSGTSTVVAYGLSTDIPVPADYDGDGTTDRAVFRPSAGDWYVLKSSDSASTGVHWGVSTDVPIPAALIPQ